jgi:hypothetical protein
MFQVSLHINTTVLNNDGSSSDDWRDADLDPKVNITLKDSIKNSKDVGKVMTAYTRQFKLPASKTNNQIFKYFHNHSVLNGFDARRKHEAILKLNGFDFKKGYVKLNKVNLKDNSPLSYEVEFFGELASLKDILGSSELKDLTSLSKFNHTYDTSTVRDGLEAGLDVYTAPDGTSFTLRDIDGDIKYPLISHTRGFEIDNQGFHEILSQEQRNSGYIITDEEKFSYSDVKPALKILRIFDAIEENFPKIQFNKTWLESSALKDIFLWLHREKGYISYKNGETIENTNTFSRNIYESGADGEYVYLSGDGDMRPIETYFSGGTRQIYNGRFVVGSVGGETFNMKVQLFANGVEFDLIELLDVEGGTTGQINFGLSSNRPVRWEIVTSVVAEGQIQSITPIVYLDRELIVGQVEQTYSATYGLTAGSIALVPDILVPLSMPKKKIIDFLSDLFKMFNLVAYEERQLDGTYKIYIESLDSYYDKGTSYDITQYIDISDSSVERISPYNSIEFKYPEPKTFLAINQAEITGDDFGSLEFRVGDLDEGVGGSDSLLFDGGEYKVEPKFEKMMYERLRTVGSKQLTRVGWGWFVNDNKENIPEPTIGEPLLLYIKNERIYAPTQYIRWSDGVASSIYNRPSNVEYSINQTLNFNAEIDEYYFTENENSLFNNFYKKYISGVYSPYARRVLIDAYLPSLIFSKIKLNDSVIIADVVFSIDNITTNLTTGETSLELLRITDFKTKYVKKSEYQLTWDTDDTVWNNKDENWGEITSGKITVSESVEDLLSNLFARATYSENKIETFELLYESMLCSPADANSLIRFILNDFKSRVTYYENEDETITLLTELTRC